MSESVQLEDLEGERQEAYRRARDHHVALTYTNSDGETRKVRYSKPLTSKGGMEGLEDALGHRMPGYWLDAPAEGGVGVRFIDEETT